MDASVSLPDRPLILREARPGDCGPMHWLAHRRNRFILTAEKVVLVERGSFREWKSTIPIHAIEGVSYRRAFSPGRLLFGSLVLLTSLLLVISQVLAYLTYGVAWFLVSPVSPILALLCTLAAGTEAVLILLYSRVAEIRITAGARVHAFVCSGVGPEDVRTLLGLVPTDQGRPVDDGA